ncbi:MAG: GspE/PulE family protein [Chloroflexi bacterium]|nr:GspE/PulE family protein [Chloroflexota bacterium]
MPDWLELLKDKISQEDLDRAREVEIHDQSPATFLIEKKLADKKEVLSALSNFYNLPYVTLDHYHPEDSALDILSQDDARRFLVLPLFRLGNDLYSAMAGFDDLYAQDYLRQLTGLLIKPVIALSPEISEAINRYYLTREHAEQTIGKIASGKKAERPEDEEGFRIEDEDAPVIKLVSYIISQGIHLGASDIHIEPFPGRILLRYRIDGILHEFPPPPPHLFKSIVSRIKIISNLDVAEKRMPQDGRSSFKVDDKEYDLRISIIPDIHGESIVMRILDPESMGKKELEDLGFDRPLYDRYKKLISLPYGIILVTGPTGSGKTTTLYATLKNIFTSEKKFVTIEDPVEYQLAGITQIQINPEIGFTFAEGLRSILRHDPDIVMLGEIRDLDSAEIAVRASLTGHLLFSTLHTNDSPSAVTRLIDMGLQSYLVFAALIAVLAQRLVRVLCPECKEKIQPTPVELKALGIEKIPEGAEIYGPVGCSSCNNLGYKGRTAIYELMDITPEMKRLPLEKTSPDALRAIAEKHGFVSLRESVLEKLFQGITSIEEALTSTTIV